MYHSWKRHLAKIPVITIIDDDRSTRDAVKRLMNSVGYAAVTFASADDFLKSSQLRDTDCLITDVQMPGMSGVDLQSYLVANGHRTPVIIVTGFPDDEVRSRALETGAFGFLTKPLSEESLLACLNRALAHSCSRNSL